MDFRWRNNADRVVEAFKVTRGARWASEDWPDWLKVQQSAKDINCVYTDASAPNALFISLERGMFQIEKDAYVVFDGGVLSVNGEVEFEAEFTKVVPIPERVLDEESLPEFEILNKMVDGQIVPRSPAEVELKRTELAASKAAAAPPDLTLVPGAVIQSQLSNLKPKAEIALELLLDGEAEAGMSVLKKALADETQWCSCAPGQCVDGPRWGCRQNSPLVK